VPNYSLSFTSLIPSNSSTRLFPQRILQSRFGSGFGFLPSTNSSFSGVSFVCCSTTKESHNLSLVISIALASISTAKIQFLIVLNIETIPKN
jgi:hypothetical protein